MALVFAAKMVAKSSVNWRSAPVDFANNSASNLFLFCAHYGRHGAVDEPEQYRRSAQGYSW